jgi:hypothetical protein
MQDAVMSLNALPEMLTNPNFVFMSRDIPDEKHANLLFFEGSTAPPSHFLNLCVRVAGQGQGICATTA